jgi:hypothetical protein
MVGIMPKAQKPKIEYDYKMRGLMVDISKDDLASMARQACEKHGQLDLLKHDIRYVWYCLPVDEKDHKNRAKFGIGLVEVVIIASFFLFVLGGIKLAELLVKWMA